MIDHEFSDQLSWTSFFLSGETVSRLEFENARNRWWINPTNNKSLRLTKEGFYRVTHEPSMTSYTHQLTEKILPKTFLQLERIIDRPYFVKNLKTLVLFDQKNSLVLTLYGNDLQKYLDNVEKHQ